MGNKSINEMKSTRTGARGLPPASLPVKELGLNLIFSLKVLNRPSLKVICGEMIV